MKFSTKILAFILVMSTGLYAQKVQRSISQLQKQSNVSISVNDQSGLAEFVRFLPGNTMSFKGNMPEDKALSFLEEFKDIYDMESVEESLELESISTDNYGLKQVVFKQVYKNVPVFDGKLKFHFNADQNLSVINGNFISGIKKLNTIPTLSKNQAAEIAIRTIQQQNLNHSGKSLQVNSNQLFVFAKGLIQGYVSSYHLVYEIEVNNQSDVREFLYVDAHSGRLVEQFTGIAHALNRKIYENDTSNLIWQEGDAFPGTLTIWQQNEVQTSGHTYNFFKHAFGYVSYNGSDIPMRTINNNSNLDCPNASWNGSTANFCDGTASDDVVAHEWGHAYTQFTSGLIYAYQSGALNEAFSDIWGETIDLLNNYEDAGEDLAVRTSESCNSIRWKIGEDATAFSAPIRDLWNPQCNGDPGKVTDREYRCGESQSGIVHTNSGIPNHAYALLVDGGTFNGQTITSLGFTKTAHIFWRANSIYLTPTSDFTNFADALEASATDLLGVNLQGLSTTSTAAGLSGEIITPSDLQSVTNAILAVELRINPDSCGYMPILEDTPPLCDAATSNPLFYEDWESGMGDWTVTQLPTNASSWISRDWNISANLPKNRSGNAMFGPDPINGDCDVSLQNGILRLESPNIVIPNITTGNFEMAFNHYVATETLWDGGNLKYSLDGGTWTLVPATAFIANPYNGTLNTIDDGNDNPLRGEDAFTGTDGGSTTSTWGQSIIDLSALDVNANSNITFRWELGTDGCNGNDGWYIDEIVVYNCSAVLSVADADILENSITIFPNPSKGIFTLKKLKALNLRTAVIYDINGRMIKQIDLSTMQSEIAIDISRVTTGVYFIAVTSENAKSVLKLIKQ